MRIAQHAVHALLHAAVKHSFLCVTKLSQEAGFGIEILSIERLQPAELEAGEPQAALLIFRERQIPRPAR